MPPGAHEYQTPNVPPPSGWQFRLTPYAWAPSVNGDVTVRGQTVDVDMPFWDIFDYGDSKAELDSLGALMGYVGARNGTWGISDDMVCDRLDLFGLAG